MKFTFLLSILFLVVAIPTAKADLLIEPVVGYNFAQAKMKSTTDNESFSGSGVGYGGLFKQQHKY